MTSVATLDGDTLLELVEALRQLGATISLPPSLTEAFDAGEGSFARPTQSDPLLGFCGEVLTDTELRVLRYLPTHLTIQEIAGEMFRSVDTIKTHVRHLYMKFDAHTRSEAVRKARSLGLLT
jgi:DNA-binding NarL/FixJ family response regulator